MAVVVYQCDTCKRELHRKQNRLGLDVVNRCVITNGCRGKLFLEAVKPSYAIGRSTAPVIGLADWTARKVLHTHKQEFLKKVWEIRHDLNNQPSVSAYVYKGDELIRVEPESISYVTNDLLTVTFPTAVTGIAQCQARSASDGQNITTLTPKIVEDIDTDTFSTSRSFPLTNGTDVGELTIATRVSTVATSGFSPTQNLSIKVHFLSPTDLTEITSVPVTLTFKDANNIPVDTNASPWGDAKYVSISGHKYLVRSANIHVGGSIGDTLTDRGIPQGAPCYFTVEYLGNPRELAPGEILILNSNAPHTKVDKIFDQITDMSDITPENASASTAYIGLDITANTALRKRIFPSIILL